MAVGDREGQRVGIARSRSRPASENVACIWPGLECDPVADTDHVDTAMTRAEPVFNLAARAAFELQPPRIGLLKREMKELIDARNAVGVGPVQFGVEYSVLFHSASGVSVGIGGN